MLVMLLVALLSGWQAMAQVTTTTIQDTVYRADGTVAGGSVVVSWPTFTTSAGDVVAAGSTSATLGIGGVLTVALTPNAGATPTGSYYTAVLHLDDGTTSKQYWVVPVSATPVTLAAIENQVLPTSVAMQTVSKAYVDSAIAQISGGGTQTPSAYVLKTGDSMTGPLILPADPVSPNQAADKHYVDTNVTALTGGMAQKVSLVPTVTQSVTQPTGTQLQVNVLNGELYANGFQSGDGSNGIANALADPACGSGCVVKVDPSYGSEPIITSQIPEAGHTIDQRGGTDAETFVDPVNATTSLSNSESLGQISTRGDANSPLTGATGTTHVTLNLGNTGMDGGSNQLPENVETPPYGKSTYSVLTESGNYYTEGQHVQNTNNINCYGVGDCLAGGQFILSSGGYRDMADEGAHPFDLQVGEDFHIFQGTCSTGCTTGSTSLTVNATSGPGTQGDGRFLIDKNPAQILTTGAITTSGRTLFGIAGFSGTNFPVSVFLQTAAAATSQPRNLAPGTVTLPIATSGVPTGFATTTVGLASSGIACVADPIVNGQEFPDFETASYTVVDASHISLTLNKVHGSNAVVAVGGLCGYGLEQTVDTKGGIRQLFPVIGSSSATSLYYADGNTTLIGNSGQASTSGYQNISLQVASIARQSNVVTVTLTANMPEDVNGLTLTVSGVADASYNGSFVVTSTGANSLTYANTGADSTSSGGMLTLLTGGYVLYPMAEVLSVFDPVTKKVDGTMTLAPNAVAWAQGDAVEEPHYYQQSTFADIEFITQYVPRPIQYANAGKQYQGLVGPGVRGWSITNSEASSDYLGAGGTHEPPDDAYMANGVWNNDFEVDAGQQALIRAHCNVHGCSRWNSGYALFALDSVLGEDFLSYQPQNHTVDWQLGGQFFTFSATSGFSAKTIGATTVNATTVNATTLTAGYNGNAQLAGGGTYTNFTLNGSNNNGTRLGFVGGGTGDPDLYLDVPTGGSFQFRVNNVHLIALSASNNGTVQSGVVQVQQVMGSGSTPSMSTGSAAGTGGSHSLSGTTLSGVLTVTTGTAPAASSTLATMGWSLPSSTPPQGCSLMPRNANAAAASGTIFTGAPTTGGWTVNVGGTALAASTAYSWSYQCM
jgi:hypothetical protein